MKEIKFDKTESDFLKTLLVKDNSDRAKKLIKKLERAEKRITTSSAKAKGRSLQYWVCERIAEIFGVEFNQSNDNCLIHSREMGQHGTDIILRGEIYKKFPFDIECKNCENLSIVDWVNQARANKKDDRDWLVVFKKKAIGSTPLILMEFGTFEKIFNK